MSEDPQIAPSQDSEPSGITFVAFVLSLAHTAAVHFGDIADPVSGAKNEANPSAAQQMIEILALLEEKTRGNLTAEERQLLDQVLFELRLRYIEVQGGRLGSVAPEATSRIILP